MWDLTVPGVECFTLANGATVHNSADGFRYLACAVKAAQGEQASKPEKKKPHAPVDKGISLDEAWATYDREQES